MKTKDGNRQFAIKFIMMPLVQQQAYHVNLNLLKSCRLILVHCLLMLGLSFLSLPVSATTNTTNPSVKAEIKITDTFPGKTRVTIVELLHAIEAETVEIAKSPAVRRDYQSLLLKHRLRDSDTLYADYVRVRIAFEATRAGGLWGVAWNITDKQPQSDLVWAQWQALKFSPANTTQTNTTAIAECDELSALFAFVARRIGLSKRSQVGLLWPTSNHTVAVWMISEPKASRIIVPTSQIFLDPAQSLDTPSFDPWKQKNIYDYRREDISLASTIPAETARYFVTQIKQYGGLSQTALQELRNQREQRQRD
jgi:hypothetical protein